MRKLASVKAGLIVAGLLVSAMALPAKPVLAHCPGGTTDISCSIVFNQSSTWNSGYSRSGAVAYEEAWAKPEYATQTYYNGFYNYANEGGASGGDCTNFVSQVLYKGGKMAFGGALPGNDFNKDWYYYSPTFPPTTTTGRTSTWTGAHQFRQYWGEVNGVGGYHAYMMRKYTWADAMAHYDQIYGDLWPGDIVQYVNSSGQTFHTQVVHSYTKDSSGNPIMLMAQHSDASDPTNTWRYDIPLKQSIQNRQSTAAYIITLKMKLSST